MNPYSEIFELYTEIAKEQGLIDTSNVKKAYDEETSRYEISTVEALYGVQPNGEEEHIMEQAHPNPAIVAPAYDRVNGLVENNLERQNIICDIVSKPNDGLLVQRRYVHAKNDLMIELIKSAFLLDRNDEYEMMKLADDCASKLARVKSNKITKQANPGALLSLLARLFTGVALKEVPKWAVRTGAATRLGAWLFGLWSAKSAVENTLKLSAGVIKDATELKEEIDDKLTEYIEITKLSDDDKQALFDFSELAGSIKEQAEEASRMRMKLRNAMGASLQSQDERAITVLVDPKVVDDLLKFFDVYKDNLTSNQKKLSAYCQIVEGMIKEHEDSKWKMLTSFLLPGTELDDIVNACGPLKKSMLRESAGLSELKKQLKQLKENTSSLKKSMQEDKKEEDKKKKMKGSDFDAATKRLIG